MTLVDGRPVAGGNGHGWPVLFPMAPFEGISVGRDPRSPIAWRVHEVRLDPVQLTATLLLVMGLPVVTGVAVAQRRPAWADRLRRPMRLVAVGGLVLLVVGAGAANLGSAVATLQATLLVVVVVNAAALALGHGAAAALRLPVRDRRAVSIEVGIQNSALALTLALNFLPDLPAAALVAAVWGLWHIVTGLALARLWRGRPLLVPATPA